MCQFFGENPLLHTKRSELECFRRIDVNGILALLS